MVYSKQTIIKSNESEKSFNSIVFISWILFLTTLILIYFKQSKIFDIWSTANLFILGILGIYFSFHVVWNQSSSNKNEF